MNIPDLKIGNLKPKLPVIQGGMGVGISMWRLASSVANCGGIGVISAVEPGFNSPEYLSNKKKANREELSYNIRKARRHSPSGILGVNIMVALNDFEEMVRTSVKEKIDIIFSGAGLPLKLPELIKGSLTKIVPIISSARAAKVICKHWDKKYGCIPDALVVEGPKAGGHLGFSLEQLENTKNISLEKLVKEVISIIKPFEEKYKKDIPVIAAGGIFDGKDIVKMLSIDASGVQMATRFVATYECDAAPGFKNQYIKARKEDIVIIESPVGMPGRAIRNDFISEVESGIKKPFKCICNCLKTCNPSQSLYCIANALINAQKGNLAEGFAFAGENAYRINKITSVKEIFRELVSDLKQY